MSQQPIAELDTHDLLEITQRIKERDTMDVALRVQNYLSTIMRSLSRFSELVLPGDHKYWKPMSENTVNTMLRNVGYDTSPRLQDHGL